MEIRRKVKNVVCKYSEPERLVREATSNDPWGPTSTVMSEVAEMTYDLTCFEEIMPIIWKRLNDKGKNWRHVYKCLLLLEYLIKCGDERVAAICLSNIHSIETLKDFQYFEEHKDHGLCVREKSKSLAALLRDDENLKLERKKGKKVKEKFQGAKSALGSQQRRRPGELGREIRRQHEKEVRFSKPVMELNFKESRKDDEDEDFKMAIALSKEEHEQSMKKKEEEERREEIKIKMAMEQSKREDEALSVLRPPPKNNNTGMSLDLLSISSLDGPERKTLFKLSESSRMHEERNGFEDLNGIDTSDPWGTTSVKHYQPSISLDFDPWQTTNDLDVTPTGHNSIGNSGWPEKQMVTKTNTNIIDDIFGDDLPNTQFNNCWNTDNKTPTFSTNVEKENQLFDNWMEPANDNFHISKKVTGSLASLTDIGIGSQDDKMKHSSSVMNLAPTKAKKTPQEFLGENANLVNLENLLPVPKAGVYRDPSSYKAKNIFGMSAGIHNNPFNSNTVQIKKPMNTMAAGGEPHYQMFSSSGNLNTNNYNANFSSFSQLPQPIIPNSQSQYQGFPMASNPYNLNAGWGQQPAVVPSYQWAAPPTNVAFNPFF